MTAEQIIKHFKMQPLRQEGGFFIETYRAAEVLKKEILPAGVSGDRNLSSVILYLLTAKTVSLMHRLKYDEMFHFYLGNPVTMLQLHPDGSSEIITLGHDILKRTKSSGSCPQRHMAGGFYPARREVFADGLLRCSGF